ncbi:MAG: hypothetical protein WCP29_07730, partial [Acidobacteriota bacterium]
MPRSDDRCELDPELYREDGVPLSVELRRDGAASLLARGEATCGVDRMDGRDVLRGSADGAGVDHERMLGPVRDSNRGVGWADGRWADGAQDEDDRRDALPSPLTIGARGVVSGNARRGVGWVYPGVEPPIGARGVASGNARRGVGWVYPGVDPPIGARGV